MAQAERKNKQASTVAKELSGMEGYPTTVTFEEVCNAVGKSPSARAILTPDQQDEAAAKLKQTGTAPSVPTAPVVKKAPANKKARAKSQRKPLTEEQQRQQDARAWLLGVQKHEATMQDAEAAGNPFKPVFTQDHRDGAYVRFVDPFAEFLGKPADYTMRIKHANYKADADARKNVRHHCGHLVDIARDCLQLLMPTKCPCGLELLEPIVVTDGAARAVIQLRRSIPGDRPWREGMDMYHIPDHYHPWCRTIVEGNVALEVELQTMEGDSPEAIALREARYETFLDDAKSKHINDGVTDDYINRAFKVLVLGMKADA